MRVFELKAHQREEYNEKLIQFESVFCYPLGADTFSINHGLDYFAFFDQLGRTHVFIGQEDDQIVAVAIAVSRNIDLYNCGNKEKVWYICDLKVHPNHRGKKFLEDFIILCTKKHKHADSKVYGISMNPLNGINRLTLLLPKLSVLSGLKLSISEELIFYSINHSQLIKVKNLLINRYGKLGFVSLSKQKDLILSSTQKPIDILHFSENGEFDFSSVENTTKYMFCFTKHDSLNNDFENLSIHPIATASIFSNITDCDWRFIRTYEI